MYMNKAKRNLILASAIVNLVSVAINLILSILLLVDVEFFVEYYGLDYLFGYSTNIIYSVFSVATGLVGSILLIYSVRKKGKYFRNSQGVYIAGFIIVVICGSYLSWILLFISLFIPDIVVMNRPSEVRQEERQQQRESVFSDKAYEEKVEKIEKLKKMRDDGEITEEEYKQKLFELL